MSRRGAVACAMVFAATSGLAVAQHSRARWIWYPERAPVDAVRQTRYFRKTFDLPSIAQRALLWVQVDDRGKYWINGHPLTKPDLRKGGCIGFNVASHLTTGRNVLAVEAYNAGNVAGVIAKLSAVCAGGHETELFSDRGWKASREAGQRWTDPEFDGSDWVPAKELGDAFMQPWIQFPGYDTSAVVTPDERAAHRAAIERLMAKPERFAKEHHARATIEHSQGSVVVTIDGRKRPAVFYRGTVDPFSRHGRRQITNFAAAGVHLFVVYCRAGKLWLGPGKYDFSSLDASLRAFLTADPDAYLIAMIRLIPPNWWMAAHPTEWVHYAKTAKLDNPDEARNVKRASLASDAWLSDTCAFWRALIRHVERQPWGKRVIGWHPGYGIYSEWHYFGSWTDQMPDTGAAMTRRFRAWLREKYATEAALRQAWARDDVTFAAAEVPGVEPRENGALGSFRDPLRERWVMDYYECQQQVTAGCLEALGRIAKDATGGRCLHGAYYGYLFGVRPQTQGGHLDLERLLASGNMDYFVAPYSYARRLMGQDGRLRSPAHAFRLAGKVHVLEGDIRTHLHPRNEHGRVQNLTESLAAIRREFTTALVEGAAFWFVDFGPGNRGGWFDDPAIMAEIARLQSLAERAIQRPRHSTTETALVCDLKSAYALTDTEGMDTAYRLIENVTTELHHTGAPFDILFLSQLPQADLRRYKLLIFLNTFALTSPPAHLLQRLREEGEHSILWFWAPGLLGDEGIDVEQASRVTGFDLHLLAGRLPGCIQVTASDSPLVAGLPKRRVVELLPERSAPVPDHSNPDHWYNPRDELTMEKWFPVYKVERAAEGVVWVFHTEYRWNDVHVLVPIEECDGLGIDLRPQGKWQRLRFKLVLIDRDGAQFVSTESAFSSGDWTTMQYTIAELDNAPWSKLRPARPAWPARGIKLVLNGTRGAGELRIGVRRLERIMGKVVERQEAEFGDGLPYGPVLLARDGRALGVAQGTKHVVFAAKGRHVLLSAPFAPRQMLAAIMDKARVHRYVRAHDDVVRADSWLMAIHTKAGGHREILLPQLATVCDAVTGRAIGTGNRVSVKLPPSSTAIWTIRRNSTESR